MTADDDESLEDLNYEDEEEPTKNEKISTSLRLDDDFLRNKTEKIRNAMESVREDNDYF